MVHTISYLTSRVGQRVSGFGHRVHHRRRTTGGGVPSKMVLIKRIASAILGGAVHRRRVIHRPRTVYAGSYKLSGGSIHRRKPRSTLTHRRRRVAY